LKATTSSSLEIAYGGVNRPVPLMTTDFMLENFQRKLPGITGGSRDSTR
jgi:hypothetical protein